ncbi:MAG TPA: DUF4342 domain-containing protein [Gemmatimonadales bacterium]|jgi:hypothetical protein|nr:DUF4342 domain-containing protein [Gemmatimonadales bacterium]
MPQTEEIKIAGEKLVERVKELVKEGNARRIIVKNDQGHAIFEIPLTVGAVGAFFLPVWVALGSIAALASHYTLVVERRDGGSTSVTPG